MTAPVTWRIRRAASLEGRVKVPGDKSISHRAALFAGLADGSSRIEGFLPAEDTLASVRLARALGADLEIDEAGTSLVVSGVGVDGLTEPADVVDCGNSGTTMRIGSGIAAGVRGLVVLTGDDSLRRRPMRRIIEPLRALGATVTGRDSDRLAPLVIRGGSLRGAETSLDVASAQVKSAVLMAGLFASGTTIVHEPGPSRDHTERLLSHLGVTLSQADGVVGIEGGQRVRARDISVPGDVSSAAFLLTAAALVEGASVTIDGVGLNATRTGFVDVLRAFGADVEAVQSGEAAGEPIGTITVRQAPLTGIELSGDVIVRAIDELPLVAVLATQAHGTTTVRDAAELRVKESDRIAAIVERLGALGADIRPTPDGFVVQGPTRLVGASRDAAGDHRIAMAMAVAGLVADGETVVTGAQCAEVSFPGFAEMLDRLAPEALTVG